MKYLILVGIVVLVLWLLRLTRRVSPPREQKRKEVEHEDMVACARCGIHLPRSEALPGRGGVFCTEAHRAAFERERDAP